MNNYILGDLLKIKNGRDHKHLEEGNIPVFGSGGLMRYVNQSLYDDESILLPRKGSLSNIQYTKKRFWTVDTLYYTEIDKKQVEPYYLYHYLKRLDLSNLNSGTGVPSMTFGAYYDIKIKLPDLPTQQKIASVLSTLDDKIELNNRINTELEAMAKTLYDYWFVQFDFPIVTSSGVEKPYKTSDGKMVYNETLKREIPEGWEVKRLDEIVEVKDGTHDSPKYIADNGFPLVTSKNLKKSGIDFTETNKISKIDFDLINQRSEVNTGDILFSMIGNIGTIYKVEEIEIDFAIKKVALFKTSQNIVLKNYIFQYLHSYDMRSYLPNVISGSIQKFVALGSLRKTPILFSEDQINKFTKESQPIYERINNNIKQNQELSALRDWLLPMLMNGQVKVG